MTAGGEEEGRERKGKREGRKEETVEGPQKTKFEDTEDKKP